MLVDAHIGCCWRNTFARVARQAAIQRRSRDLATPLAEQA